MNIENLERTIEMLKGIPQGNFNMRYFRADFFDKSNHICGSVGCIVGHATSLDTEQNVLNHLYPYPEWDNESHYIDFGEWAYKFYELKTPFETEFVWYYLFCDVWADDELTNTPEHAIYRIKKIIDGYRPNEIYEEFNKEVERLKK